MKLTLITGNQGKAEQLKKWLGRDVDHISLDLDEIQSLELRDVVEHKVTQAYEKVHKPVLVEDVELRCDALRGLPGPLVKWFIKDDIDLLCQMLDSFDSRHATVRVMYALYDGKNIHYFEGETPGEVTRESRGDNGFGWDAIFVPDGSHLTRAEQSEREYEASSPRAKAIVHLKKYLENEKA